MGMELKGQTKYHLCLRRRGRLDIGNVSRSFKEVLAYEDDTCDLGSYSRCALYGGSSIRLCNRDIGS